MLTRDDIAALFETEADGPFVTAYLNAPSDEPNAGFHLTSRWKALRSTLAEAGAGETTLEAVDAALDVDTEAVRPEPRAAEENQPAGAPEVDAEAEHTGGDLVAVVARGDRVLLSEHLSVTGAGLPEAADRGRVGPLPWVTPLVVAAAASVPYVLAIADRRGIDLHGYGVDVEVDTTREGTHDQIERNAPGGWSQKRYQQRAIDSWERNGAEAADAVADLADRIAARVVLVGGDDHAVGPLIAALPKRWAERTDRLEHATRAEGGDDALVEDEVRRLVQTVRASDTKELLERFRQERGRGERAADGPGAVVAALQGAMVDTLLVHDDLGDDRTAWFGPEPNHIGLDESDLAAMGVQRSQTARLIDVAVRAAMGTGAEVRVVPAATVQSGLGAVLRAPA
jgi:hypothetical protein